MYPSSRAPEHSPFALTPISFGLLKSFCLSQDYVRYGEIEIFIKKSRPASMPGLVKIPILYINYRGQTVTMLPGSQFQPQAIKWITFDGQRVLLALGVENGSIKVKGFRLAQLMELNTIPFIDLNTLICAPHFPLYIKSASGVDMTSHELFVCSLIIGLNTTKGGPKYFTIKLTQAHFNEAVVFESFQPRPAAGSAEPSGHYGPGHMPMGTRPPSPQLRDDDALSAGSNETLQLACLQDDALLEAQLAQQERAHQEHRERLERAERALGQRGYARWAQTTGTGGLTRTPTIPFL